MMYSKRFLTPIIIGLLISSPISLVQADDDHIEAKRLRDAGEILPLEEILKHARQSHPGKVLEVEIEDEGSRMVYEVEILGDDSIVREILIDARSGKLISVTKDN